MDHCLFHKSIYNITEAREPKLITNDLYGAVIYYITELLCHTTHSAVQHTHYIHLKKPHIICPGVILSSFILEEAPSVTPSPPGCRYRAPASLLQGSIHASPTMLWEKRRPRSSSQWVNLNVVLISNGGNPYFENILFILTWKYSCRRSSGGGKEGPSGGGGGTPHPIFGWRQQWWTVGIWRLHLFSSVKRAD